MCGIAGVRRFAGEPITHAEVSALLCQLEHRGRDATGIAALQKGKIHILKAPVAAWQFTKTDAYTEFLKAHVDGDTEIVLLHDRWASVGGSEENKNNHPMWDGETAIVHNGHINNHTQLFDACKLSRSAETDSDYFRAAVSEFGMHEKGIRELSKANGSAAIACISEKYPGELLLARSGSPLVIAFANDGDKMYWASEAKALISAAKPFYLERGVWVQALKSNLRLGPIPDNSAWLFDKDKLILHHEFKTLAGTYHTPNYRERSQSGNWNTRNNNWRKKGKKVQKVVSEALKALSKVPVKNLLVECVHCQAANENTTGKPLSEVNCGACGKLLLR